MSYRSDGDDIYQRKRAAGRSRRSREQGAAFDPQPPADSDWTLADGSGLRRVSGPVAVADVLADLIGRSHWRERLDGVAVHERWPEIAGSQLAGHCEPVRLAGGTLLVRAASQAWATQLGYMLPQLMARANAVLGEAMVQHVNLTVGPLRGPDAGDG